MSLCVDVDAMLLGRGMPLGEDRISLGLILDADVSVFRKR